MKILYIATERRAAQLAAHSLRELASDVALSWARSLASAVRWIHDNRDVTAVIVEAELQRQGSASFTESLRGLGVTAPVVVVAREQADLLQVVSGAVERTRAAARDAKICTALQTTLFELESRLLNAEESRASEAAARLSLEQNLTDVEADRRDADQRHATELGAAAQREEALAGRLDRESTMRASLARELDETRAKSELEHETLMRLLCERDAELEAQAARHLAAQQAANDALRQAEERHRLAAEAARRDEGRLRQEIDALQRELKVTGTEVEGLRSEATRIPLLQMEVEQGKKDARRQFERAPYPLCRCTRDGTITHVNHSLARLLGYRKADDLLNMEFSSVFECVNDLRWLIERSTNTEVAEAVETTWKTADRRRLHVRLHALTSIAGSIDIAVENITGLREVEERLRQAHRMEAVGRLASEVAVTCDSLLRDVAQGGHQWLDAVSVDVAQRQLGEMLFGEVTRAAGLLRQFAVYGDRQISALQPVSVQKVLRNLGPVLKLVAGEDVRIALPKTSAPFDVDVEAERVERILVNVASYARERMPHGGRIKIDLATTVVDRRFLASHPNVRPGPHVLLTVTEVRGSLRSVLPIQAQPERGPAGATASSSGKPGVDLGALLGLIADCEGHLWMAAEPSGNMTLKIYLPSREAVAGSDATAAPAQSGRGRQLARWFGH